MVGKLAIFLVETIHESLGKLGTVQSLSNEYKLVDFGFTRLPWFLGRSELGWKKTEKATLSGTTYSHVPTTNEQRYTRFPTHIDLLVDSLKNEFSVALSMKAQQSLGSVNVGGTFPQQVHHENVEPLSMQLAFKFDTDGLHHFQVVFGISFLRLEKVGIDSQDGFHVETVETQNLFQRCSGLFRFNDGSKFVDFGQSLLQCILFFGRYQINLVEENLVGKGDLLIGLVDAAVGFLVVQVDLNVFGIGQTHDGINKIIFAHFGVGLYSVDNWCGIGQSGGFQQNGIKVYKRGRASGENSIPKRTLF
jgi:hypothetical protein